MTTSGKDHVLIKYDSSKTVLWTRTYSANENEVSYSGGMAVDGDNVYVAVNVYTTGTYLAQFLRATVMKYDSEGGLAWSREYTSALNGMKIDGNGNFYFGGTVDDDYLIVKYDNAGNLIWSRSYDLTASTYYTDAVDRMVVDSEGNIYTLVRSSSWTSIYSTYHLIKHDIDGNIAWSNLLSGLSYSDIALDGSNNIYVAGSTVFMPSVDALTIKYDSHGNVLWSKTYDTGGRNDASKIAVDQDGNAYVSGTTMISDTAYGDYITTFKYDPAGNVLWSRKYDEFYNEGGTTGVALDGNGNIYITGDTDCAYAGCKSFFLRYGPALCITTDALSDGHIGVPYSQVLNAVGSLPPYTWSIISGFLPGGVALNSATGEISGGPTTVGLFNFTAHVISANSTTVTKSYSITVPDTTPPSTNSITSGIMGNNGWYVSNVGVALTASDSESGVKEIHYGIDGTETIMVGSTTSFTLSTDGTHSITYYAKDNAGNSETAHPLTINIDKTPPTITIIGIANGAVYTLGGVPTVGYTVTDTGSGVATQNATLTGGNANGVGTYTYTVNATDKAGNAATVSATYSVEYGFSGFLEPISLGKPFKLGSTIPVKFQLTNAQGNYVSTAIATISVQQFSGEDPVGDPIVLSANGADTGNMFRYDAAGNLYIFNLGTKDLVQGTWQIRAALDDGTVKSVFIQLKKN
jgi:hypothetical protein